LRAVESLLAPAGIRADMLKQWMTKQLPTPHVHVRLAAKTAHVYWGPLFEFAERGEAKSRLARVNTIIAKPMSGNKSTGLATMLARFVFRMNCRIIELHDLV
jgi:hypothetical protein